MKTPAPDGMIIDENGNLYMGDLENSSVVYLTPDRKEIRTLVQGGNISWPDTFAIYKDELYFTNSRIHEAVGDILFCPAHIRRKGKRRNFNSTLFLIFPQSIHQLF